MSSCAIKKLSLSQEWTHSELLIGLYNIIVPASFSFTEELGNSGLDRL